MAWKSVSSYKDSALKDAALFALRTIFVLSACARSLRRARGFFAIPSASLGCFSWKDFNMRSEIFRSMKCPPRLKSTAEPRMVTTGAVFPATMPAALLSYWTIVASAFLEPKLKMSTRSTLPLSGWKSIARCTAKAAPSLTMVNTRKPAISAAALTASLCLMLAPDCTVATTSRTCLPSADASARFRAKWKTFAKTTSPDKLLSSPKTKVGT
mmetsp:Transcript_44697/g.103318  ORF Transcript_44697/g.103318 Transcript_44697/m.103318 type:complete len:212 (-) Transcript_44697:478-1113(-)